MYKRQGLLLGLLAALKYNTIWDSLATVISVIGVSVPSYVFALDLSYSLGFRLQWFPMLYKANNAGMSSVLPSIALSMFTIGEFEKFKSMPRLEY